MSVTPDDFLTATSWQIPNPELPNHDPSEFLIHKNYEKLDTLVVYHAKFGGNLLHNNRKLTERYLIYT